MNYFTQLLNYQFGPAHPLQPIREKYTFEAIKRLGILDGKAKHYEPGPAREEDLLLVHSKEYIEFVKQMSEIGVGYLDYGDTPVTKGIYEASCSVVGGSVLGAKLIMEGEVSHAFNPGGGLHHADRDHAAGFCVFNDVAVVVRYLQREYGIKKIVVVDIDGHHGDGTQRIFYGEPILTISAHRIGIYPGTGYVDEVGEGEGEGYSVNIPLPAGTHDEAYLYAFSEIVPPLIEAYEPEILVNQFGVDGHYRDPLVGLGLTTKAYLEVSSRMHELAHKICGGKYLILGGGGYDPKNVSRCWTVMFAAVAGVPAEELKEFFDVGQPGDDRVFEEVKRTVERVKRLIFPMHGLVRG